MKYVKMASLAVVAVAALMAFVGSSDASADVLCTEAKTPCPAGKRVSEIHAVNTKTVKITTGYNTIECTGSTITGVVTADGGAGVPVEMALSTYTLTGCNCSVTVVEKGTFKINQIGGTNNGAITSNGTEITTSCNTVFGTVHCLYGTENTALGEIVGAAESFLVMEEDHLLWATNVLCSEKAQLDAQYTITNHNAVYVVSN